MINIHNEILSIYFWKINVPKVDETHFFIKSSFYSLLVALGWDEDLSKWTRVDSEPLAGAHHPKGETICLLKSALRMSFWTQWADDQPPSSSQDTGPQPSPSCLYSCSSMILPELHLMTPSFTESQGHQPCDTSKGQCPERAPDSEPAMPTESRSQELEGSRADVGMGCPILCRGSQPLGSKARWSEMELTS